jgi:hypothetical protein
MLKILEAGAEITDQRLEKEKKLTDMFLYWKFFALTYRFQITHESNEHHLEKFKVKILVKESVSE